MTWITQNEVLFRLGIFLTALLTMLVIEKFIPARTAPSGSKLFSPRQTSNLSLTIINTIALRLVPGISAVSAAGIASQQQWGLFNQIQIAPGLILALTILFLDAAIYLQHLAFHHIPLLWRIHRVHHCDSELDATTALRFHPVEIIPSAAYKFIIALALGAPVYAVIVFEVILNASAIFNHANIKLPEKIDRLLRRVIVTPAMHSSHHSPKKKHTNSNYGFFLSVWDRLGKTYTSEDTSEEGIGLHGLSNAHNNKLLAMLRLPTK